MLLTQQEQESVLLSWRNMNFTKNFFNFSLWGLDWVSYVHRLFPVGWALWKSRGQLKAIILNVVFLNMSLSAQVWQILHLVMVKVSTSWKSAQSRKDTLSCVTNFTSSLSLCFYPKHQQLCLNNPEGLLVKGSAVTSSFEGAMDMNWTFPHPLMTSGSDSTCWTRSDSGSIPSKAHAPPSFRSRTGWARQHFAQGLSMLPILLGGSQLFIENYLSSPLSVSSLQTIALEEVFWQCHVLQVAILSGVSLGRVQISYSLFEEPSTPLKKRRNMLDWIQKPVNSAQPATQACIMNIYSFR